MHIDNNILNRYLQGTCSTEEQQLVEQWYAQLGEDVLLDDNRVEQIVAKLDARVPLEEIEEPVVDKKVRKLTPWLYAAAAAAILFVFGLFFFQPDQVADPALVDVMAPKGENSILVFEDNRELELDNLKIGDTVMGDGYLVTRNADGEISYTATDPEVDVIYNTVRTKAGGITSLVLADGSKVWLNSKSEIRYPVNFNPNYREVALKGEAYFEVEKAAERPFYVRSEGHTIKVLGTRFNVNNRPDGFMSTLLEGKIAVTNETTKLGDEANISYPVVLKPNEAFNGRQVTYVEDAQKVLDWKEGYFDLTGLTMEEAAEKMSIWYDVEFEMDGDIKNMELFGNISKDKSLRQVCELLKEILPVTYVIEDNKVKLKHLKK